MKNCLRNHYFVAFFSTLLVSVGLLITSFFLPPQGKIDPSVLQGTAIIFCWPALAFAAKALDDNKKVKITTKVGTVTVGHSEDDSDPDGTLDIMEGEEAEE
jgi:hypothetical protein